MSAYADTNLLVRHLTSDHVEHARRATALLHGGEQLFLTAAILIETAHVLRSRYGFAREQVVAALEHVLALPAIVAEDVLPTALALHVDHRIDLADAVLAAHALLMGPPQIASFDADFDRIPGLVRMAP